MIPDFNLPARTLVNKVVPKNAFDAIATNKQKRLLVELVERIIWQNKLSAKTINLDGTAIREIQVFDVTLRKREKIPELLMLIDKAIPYPILFVISFQDEYYLNLTVKHPNPADQNLSVIDWVFRTEWLNEPTANFGFALRRNLDYVMLDLCSQLATTDRRFDTFQELANFEKHKFELESSVEKFTSAIKKTSQFKEKVALNHELQKLKKELKKILQPKDL